MYFYFQRERERYLLVDWWIYSCWRWRHTNISRTSCYGHTKMTFQITTVSFAGAEINFEWLKFNKHKRCSWAPPRLEHHRNSWKLVYRELFCFFCFFCRVCFLIETRGPATSENETTANKIHHSYFAVSHIIHAAVRRPLQKHRSFVRSNFHFNFRFTSPGVRSSTQFIYFILRAHQWQIAPPLFSHGPSFCTSLS